MEKREMRLCRIEGKRPFDRETDRAFFLLLQRGLLLALQESGILTERQLWAAEEKLAVRERSGGKAGGVESE